MTEKSNLYEQSFKVDASRLQPKLYPRTQNAKSLLSQMIESQQQSFNRATDLSAYNTVYTGQTNSSSRGHFQNFATKQSISPAQRHGATSASKFNSRNGTFRAGFDLSQSRHWSTTAGAAAAKGLAY